MAETEQRARVIECARSWLGTPYHHMGRLKGVGVDCGMLLAEVYAEAEVIDRADIAAYSPQFFLHREDPAYLREILKHARAIEIPTGPGDIVVYKVGRQHAHGAIIVSLDPLRIIHAFANYRFVVEGDESEFALTGKDKLFFSCW